MKKERGTSQCSRRRFLGCCGCVVGAATVAGGVLFGDALNDTGDIQETYLSARIPGLPSVFDGLTITQVSDLHIRSFGDLERRLIARLQERPQQLIAITGDFADDPGGVEATLRAVTSLHAAYGVWAVPGNVDYYDDYDNGNPPPIFDSLRRVGVHLLRNGHAPAVQHGDRTLYLLGVDDPVHNFADLGAALQGMPADAPRILLAHSPDIIDSEDFQRVGLALVGHTHGGQIRLPLVPPAIGHSEACMTYSAGMYRLGPTQLYVNRGIGTSHIPLRFACPPEITYIRLEAC